MISVGNSNIFLKSPNSYFHNLICTPFSKKFCFKRHFYQRRKCFSSVCLKTTSNCYSFLTNEIPSRNEQSLLLNALTKKCSKSNCDTSKQYILTTDVLSYLSFQVIVLTGYQKNAQKFLWRLVNHHSHLFRLGSNCCYEQQHS